MAFVYEVNGQKVEFENEPTEKDIDEAARSLKPAPVSQRKVTETGGGAAIILPNITGRRPESQQDREASKDMSLQTARGVASNVPAVLGIPGSIVNAVANIPRTAQDLQNRYERVVSGSDAPLPPLPEYNQVTPYDMSYFSQLVPGPQPTSPQGQLAFAGGMAAGSPIGANIINRLPLKEAGKAVMSPIETTKNLAQSPINFGRGFTEGYFNPQGARPGVSAMVPLESYYYPETAASQFTKGEIGLTELERSKIPSASLFNSPSLQKGLNVATKNEAGQPMIPLQGRKMEAFGEQLGREYANKPLAGALDIAGAIGGMATAGVPLTPSAAMRAYQGFKTRQLGQAANFSPEFAQKYAEAAKAAQTPAQKSMEVAASKINTGPIPGPVSPSSIPTQQTQPVVAPATQPVARAPAPAPKPQPVASGDLKQLQNQLNKLDDEMTMLREEHLGRDLSTVESIAYRNAMDKMYGESKILEKQIAELKKALKIKK